MVGTAASVKCNDSINAAKFSTLVSDDAPSFCTVLNRGKEFPKVKTEIGGLVDVTTTSCFAGVDDDDGGVVTVAGFGGDGGGGAAAGEESSSSTSDRVQRRIRNSKRFSLFNWFKKTDTNSSSVDRGSVKKYHQHNINNNNNVNNQGHENKTRNKAVKDRATNFCSIPTSANTASGIIITGNTSINSIYSSSGSVDTSCSTATVHSFTFRHGNRGETAELDLLSTEKSLPGKRRFNQLNRFRKHLSAEDFDSSRLTNGGLNYSFDGTKNNCNVLTKVNSESYCGQDKKVQNQENLVVDEESNSIKNREIKLQSLCNYRSLPAFGKKDDLSTSKNKLHVRGKRRAPKPPNFKEEKNYLPETKKSLENCGIRTARRKRRAPKPPVDNKKETIEKCDLTTSTSHVVTTENSSEIEKKVEDIINIPKPELPIMSKSIDPIIKHSSDKNSVISNDTLKLEGGYLLPATVKSSAITQTSFDSSPIMNNQKIHKDTSSMLSVKKNAVTSNQSSNVVPRPWYKRSNTTLSERDCSSFKRDVLKIPTLTKSREKKSDGRFSLHQESQNSNTNTNTNSNSSQELGDVISFDRSFSRLNHFFGRTTSDRRDDCNKTVKKEEKRKSNLSILTNISELDREAAAIVQEEQARNQAILARSSASFQSSDLSGPPSGDIISELVSSSIEPSQRRGTRALISKFNAIGNKTKVTVNATFFSKSSNQPNKIDVVREAGGGDSNKINNRCSYNCNDRIVTKRLLYDGTEQINETDDISSINFFRRLEAAEANQVKEGYMEVRGKQKSTAGWEEKIKRYFPERMGANETQKVLVSKNEKTVKKIDQNHLKETVIGNSQNSQQHKKLLRSDRSSRVDAEFEFFNEPNAKKEINEPNLNSEKITNTVEPHLSRADLKEMLIEMKHSLPKRPKPKSTVKSNPASTNNANKLDSSPNNGDRLSNSDRKEKSSSSSLVGQKSKVTAATASNSRNVERSRQSFEEAPPLMLEKTKVSSGVQTSANLRKVETPNRDTRSAMNKSQKQNLGWKYEDTIYTTTGRTNGTANGVLTRNTFQLIRPRDFACIEALKTEKGPVVKETGQNTYMNVIEDSIYANTIIYPTKNNPIEEGMIINSNNKNINDNKSEPVQHYTANVTSKVKVQETLPKLILPQSVQIIKEERVKKAVPEPNMNTVAINRLLRKLEGAIASGQHQQAAGLAKELAQLKIHCSVVRQRSENIKVSDLINVDMYIEDKLAHQGPIPLQLSLNATVTELKKKIFDEFEIPTNVQRWIIGKNLADNDNSTLNELNAVDKSSIFLYLVAPDLQNDESTRVEKMITKEEVKIEATVEEQPREIVPTIKEEPAETLPQEPSIEELKLKRYEHLMSLENSDVIPNSVPIECPICFAPYGPCEGVILRDCLHMFCRTCIANTIMYCEEAEVKCPFRDSEYTCESTLQEREIKALVTPEVYEQHLAKSVSQAENSAGNNAFHCKTPDCPGWCIYDDNVNIFLCPVCGVNNCLTCQAIHTNKNCREYQDEIKLMKETDQETKRTAAVLEEMVESGEALACPTCAVVLMKKWGCDWLRCSMCKTEICWVTRGPRWGPGGKGDTSGGCKCGENGVKCHPRCNYCH